MPQSEKMEMAKLFVESKMFDGISAIASAFVKIQAGAEIGLSPFASMSGIHIIKGKVSIGAGLMAGCVKGSPKYDYIVKQMDDTVCSIDFTTKAGKVIGNSTFTIADAKKAGTQNLEKFPKNMLFARAMSNGAKWFCPDVFTMPVYTPEEMGDPNFTEDIPHTEATQTTAAITPTVVKKGKVLQKAFDAAIVRLEAGEIFLYQKLKDTYDLSDAQNKALEPYTVKAEELASGIKGLELCEIGDDIEAFKLSLPAYIVADASFIEAGKARYGVLVATPA